MTQRYLLLGLALLFLVPPLEAREDVSLEARLAKVDELLRQKFPTDAPGAAVLIVADGKIVLHKGYGLADVERKLPISPQTQFDLASVSKQFTALAVLILHERGQLSLDDDVRKYLPELPEYDAKRPIRIRDLVCHTSGIKDYLFVWKGTDAEFARLHNEDMLPLLARQKLVFPTGSKWAYSNSNYLLLPIIVQRVTAKPFRQFLQEEIFTPLAMTNTVLFDCMHCQVPHRAKGYSKTKDGWKHVAKDSPIMGDGNIFTCTEDLAKWDAAWRDGKLLKPETRKLAWTPGKLNDGKDHNYACGWMVSRKDGKLVVGHGGGWTGTRTEITRWVDDRITLVLLCNDEGRAPQALRQQIAKLLFPEPTK